MRKTCHLLGLAAALSAVTQSAEAADSNALANERWKTRPLVVFAASDRDPALSSLRRELRQPAVKSKFDEREMVLYSVVGDEARRGDQALPAGQAATLRKALSVDPATPFQAVLVGKDGGVKIRQTRAVDLPALFTTIDAMPMRARQDRQQPAR